MEAACVPNPPPFPVIAVPVSPFWPISCVVKLTAFDLKGANTPLPRPWWSAQGRAIIQEWPARESKPPFLDSFSAIGQRNSVFFSIWFSDMRNLKLPGVPKKGQKMKTPPRRQSWGMQCYLSPWSSLIPSQTTYTRTFVCESEFISLF